MFLAMVEAFVFIEPVADHVATVAGPGHISPNISIVAVLPCACIPFRAYVHISGEVWLGAIISEYIGRAQNGTMGIEE
jgi:hypothetical protein